MLSHKDGKVLPMYAAPEVVSMGAVIRVTGSGGYSKEESNTVGNCTQNEWTDPLELELAE